jgi:hypothetical protein
MIKKLKSEEWKPVLFKGHKLLNNHYALSSQGRAASFKEEVYGDGKLLKGSHTSGYPTLNMRIGATNLTLFIHREIAKLFCKKSSPKEKFVIHVNHDRTDNRVKNLKWATQKEVIAHQQKSPLKIAYKEEQKSLTKGLKLNATQVKAIKKTLENPRRRMTNKALAEKYDVSEMTIYRIKSGESWSRIS